MNSDHPIRRFKINRLYGYKDIEIAFERNLRIVIAGNGSGKTIILNALHSFLRVRFHRLALLNFESIECDFQFLNEPVVLKKSDIPQVSPETHAKMHELASRAGLPDDDLYDFLRSEYRPEKIMTQTAHPIISSLYIKNPGNHEQLGVTLDALHQALDAGLPENLRLITAQIVAQMQKYSLLYLPTYRRIEMSLLRPKQRAVTRYDVPEQVLPDVQHMNFGLADVEFRLNYLSDNVERVSAIEYRNISATIIDDAVAGKINIESKDWKLPDIDSLKRFLSRVDRDPQHFLHPFYRTRENLTNKERMRKIADLYDSEEIYANDNYVLRYFLGRLSSVIDKTKETEGKLQQFVDACNRYLGESSDEKVLNYDLNDMRVSVMNTWTNNEIPLSQLSSGEKQIVSILASLYLHEGQKIVLIDEPELSLSIDWQRKILPEMLGSGSVAQLLAITHSPFIFDNELDPYAGSLNVTKHPAGNLL